MDGERSASANLAKLKKKKIRQNPASPKPGSRKYLLSGEDQVPSGGLAWLRLRHHGLDSGVFQRHFGESPPL